MIFFAVAGPTPGSASRSDCDAVLMFTGADAGFVCELLVDAACPAAAGSAIVNRSASDHEIILDMIILSFGPHFDPAAHFARRSTSGHASRPRRRRAAECKTRTGAPRSALR